MSDPNPEHPDAAAPKSGGNRAKPLTPAAQRALAEAAARRAERDSAPRDPPRELRGRGGLDPVRYGDWEKDGLTSDF